MNKRENVLSLLRRQGYEEAVVHLEFCPSLDAQFRERTGWQGDPWDYFGVPWREVDGDDVGMQRAPMMSIPLYVQWLKPRLKRVIAAARSVKLDILVIYPFLRLCRALHTASH